MAAGSRKPSLRVERALQRDGYPVLAGMDEVGRGALAGPVTVGVVVIDESCRSAPSGVRDSKLLTPAHRERMVPRIRRWSLAYAVGHASNEEIDQVGIIAALRLAGHRALSALPVEPDLVILDGNHDWLTPPDRVGLFALVEPSETDRPDPPDLGSRRVGARQGRAGRAHGRAAREPPGIRMGREQGVCRARAPRRSRRMGAMRPAPAVVATGSHPGRGGRTERTEDVAHDGERAGMSSEDLEQYETEQELALYREYRDVVSLFTHVVETERRFYLCNSVDMKVRSDGGEVFFDVTMSDAWVWDIYRPARFVKSVRVVTFKDVNIEELPKSELEPPA